ncbi:putative F-box/LRR-repeat protein at1g56400 [Phtheirospermum japonicum]|uniref:Putative F-box/LRR-repeat protein at1g56400 n=1 Tax=Phtheirospermum japonicum TaxID=374723 RepID=A0A830CFF2_9LAMI|nr:putative F-box/LRR-repeat protein at1g56400 [Phtheirospermum japonicum]
MVSDHSPLTILGEDKFGNAASVLPLSADHNLLFVGHENGSKMGKWLFSGGWDKTFNVQPMKKSTHRSKRNRKAAIKRRLNRLKFLRKELELDNRDDNELVDRISELPDEILISILSRLTLPQAIATSILSTRWRYLHTYIDHLKFPPFKILPYFETSLGERQLKFSNFIRANVERWLEFALGRRVETIDLRMRCADLMGGRYSLQLSNLTIEFSKRLINVSVVGQGALLNRLKHLDISYAENLKSIEIRDMINLISFKCYGDRLKYALRLDNLPKLTEFNTREYRDHTLAEVLPTIPSCIHDQLRVLKVWTTPPLIRTYLPAYELINVKHLELKVNMDASYSTIRLFPLIEACCSLEKLEIEFLWMSTTKAGELKDCEVSLFSPSKKLSPNLKNLTMSGYLGSAAELEFALVMMNKAASLEELSLEPCDLTPKIRRMATARAWKQFRPLTPNPVNLVIL